MGMCMERRGVAASVVMTSTWHRVGGPMADLMDRARAGDFPLYTFCAFEVLERCPRRALGPEAGTLPELPLAAVLPRRERRRAAQGEAVGRALRDRRADPEGPLDQPPDVRSGLPLQGAASRRHCGSRASTPRRHVATRAEYDPSLPVHMAVDSGVFTGAVFFQVARTATPAGMVEEVRVFADYLAESLHGRGERPRDPRSRPDALQRPDRRGLDRPGGRCAQPGRADGHRRVRARRAASVAALAARLGGRRPGPGRVVRAAGRRATPIDPAPAL